jgi:hypothetical protein
LALLPSLPGGGQPLPREGDGRQIVVGCTSTVGFDAGGCLKLARRKCRGEAQHIRTLSSVPLAGSGLHTVSARYRCATTAR